MSRFLLLAIPLLILIMALFGLVQELVGIEAPGSFGWHPRAQGVKVAVAAWVLESMALTALFLLARGRAPSWWLDGLLTGWLAWLFRGPVVILAIASLDGVPQLPWRQLAIGWWVLYSICGLTLAILSQRLETGRG